MTERDSLATVLRDPWRSRCEKTGIVGLSVLLFVLESTRTVLAIIGMLFLLGQWS